MSQIFQENISVIEPDHSFEFQKGVENFCNASNNLSLDNSIQSEKCHHIQQSPTVTSTQKNNLVMIDQDQLMELLQAKQILDAQKQTQNKGAQQINTEKIMKEAFGNALFLTPQTIQPFSTNSSPSTKESSESNQNTSGQDTTTKPSVLPFSEPKMEADGKNSVFSSSIFSSSAPVMKNNSKYSQIYNLNQNLTNTNKLDSRFNKDFIEKNNEQNTSQANCSILGTSAQGRAIGNDLLHIIDCDSSVDSIKGFKETAKQEEQRPKQEYGIQNTISTMTNRFQNFNIGDNFNSSPESNEYSNQSSSLTNENSGSSGEYQSIFTQQNQYVPIQASKAQLVNNSINKAAINAPAFKPTSFKPLDQIKSFVPTNQAKDNGEKSPVEDQAKKDTSTKKSKGLFAFPEGGWECSKCQNYNFKGRDNCHRCKKEKDDEDYIGKPKHMSQAKLTKKQKKQAKAEKDAADKVESVNTQTKMEFANKWANNSDYRAPKEKKQQENKMNQPSQNGRNGDWTCQRCMNHNFAFRETCNICYMGQLESNRILFQKQAQNQMEYVQQQWCQQQVPMPQYNHNMNFNSQYVGQNQVFIQQFQQY